MCCIHDKCTGRALYLRRQSHRALRKFLREKVQVISSRPFPTVLCKSNTNELWWFSWLLVVFWGNFAANEIFVNFPRTSKPPIVLVYQNYNWYFAVDASELWIQEGKLLFLKVGSEILRENALIYILQGSVVHVLL